MHAQGCVFFFFISDAHDKPISMVHFGTITFISKGRFIEMYLYKKQITTIDFIIIIIDVDDDE